MLLFGGVLPRIRAQVDTDLRRHGLPRERVLAAIVRLMELTLFRIGNVEYSKANKSFGLTTLRNRHAVVDGDRIRLSFRGKSGVRHEGSINDRRLARIVKNCRDLPGYELFQYSTMTAIVTASTRPTSTFICARSAAKTSPQRISAPGPALISRRSRYRNCRLRQPGCRQVGDRPRCRAGGQASRQHCRRLPQMLHSPGDFRRLSRRHAGAGAGGQDKSLPDPKRRRDECRRGRGRGLLASAADDARRQTRQPTGNSRPNPNPIPAPTGSAPCLPGRVHHGMASRAHEKFAGSHPSLLRVREVNSKGNCEVGPPSAHALFGWAVVRDDHPTGKTVIAGPT